MEIKTTTLLKVYRVIIIWLVALSILLSFCCFFLLRNNIDCQIKTRKRMPMHCHSFLKNSKTGLVTLFEKDNTIATFYDSTDLINHRCPDTILIHNNKDTLLASDFR